MGVPLAQWVKDLALSLQGVGSDGRKKRKPIISLSLSSFFFFIWPHLWHVEVLRPGIKLMPQQKPKPLVVTVPDP